jgi:DNA polymerase-3 subunit epsilon
MRRVFIDCESTGLDTRSDQVIEVAAIEVIDRKIGNSVEFRCKPTCRMDLDAQRVHGISMEMLANEPPFADRANILLDFLEGADEVLAHNASYDVAMLDAEFARANISLVFGQKFKVVDTLRMARAAVSSRRHSLKALAEHFRVEYDEQYAHGALYDVRTLARVWLAMTAGQTDMDLAPKRVETVALTSVGRVQRIVFLKPEELEAHKKFCADNKIPCF